MRGRYRVLPAHFALLLAIAGLPILAGCGKGSPTSPLVGAATISGSVVGTGAASSSGGPSTAAPSAGVVVAVVGTGVSTTVDMNDSFTLMNVPAADIALKFTGPGVSSQVALGTIAQGEHVSVTITRNGGSMTLENIRRMGGDVEELEGRIDGLPPTTAAGTFSIAGQNVQTDANTKFLKGDAAASFADLQIGLRVHVKGTPNSGGVLAKSVRIQDPNPDLNVQVEGLIANFSGVPTSFQFSINGRLIKGDATTVFDTGLLFAGLANGVRVEVHGVLQTGFIAATKIEIEEAEH